MTKEELKERDEAAGDHQDAYVRGCADTRERIAVELDRMAKYAHGEMRAEYTYLAEYVREGRYYGD